MFYAYLFSFTLSLFSCLLLLIPKFKYKVILMCSFFICALISVELFANFTGLLYVTPNIAINIPSETLSALNSNNIPKPIFKVSRFVKNVVTIDRGIVILPVNYVEFNKFKINYIMLLFIESNTISIDNNNEIKNIIEKSQKENKEYLLPLRREAIISNNRTTEEKTQILENKGETICHFSFSEIRRKCIFIPVEDLNMSRFQYLSEDEFVNNVANNFNALIKYTLKNKVYSKYANVHSSYDTSVSGFKSISWF